GASLSWTASTGGTGAVSYDVFRRQGTVDTLLAQVSVPSTALTGLTANTSYQVFVRARDAAGNLSGNSGLVTFTTLSGNTGATCGVRYTPNTWNTGFTADLFITNAGTSTINGWTLTFSFPGNQVITNWWNVTITQNQQAVTAVNVGHNGTIAPNATVN